jgi:hypothetical protein
MEVVVAQSRYHFHGGTHENNEEPQSTKAVSRSRFEPSISPIEVSTIVSPLTFSVLQESLVTQITKKLTVSILLYSEL